MWTTLDNRREGNGIFLAVMATLVALAWLALWLSDRSDHHGFLHYLHDLNAFDSGAFMLVFVTGWTVMVIAMMLPTSLPLISIFRSITRGREDRNLLVSLLITGYLTVWTLFGIIVCFGGRALREGVGQSSWLEANMWVLGAGVLMLAGLYQFTSLKYRCLDKCRSPFGFVVEHWRGSRERPQALLLGARHGLFCVGCCWSLMLLMFLVGSAGTLLWMLVLGAVMAVEKNMSWGKRIGIPLGVLLVGAGLALGATQALQMPGETTAGTNVGATMQVSLAATGHTGVRGVANFTDLPSGVKVEVRARGLPEARARYLAHIHPGSCTDAPADGVHHDHGGGEVHNHHGDHADRAGEPVGEIEHPLKPLVAGADGSASSVISVEGATVARLFSDDPGYHINVHTEASGSGELPTVACGDLREEQKESPEHDHKEEYHDH